MWKIKLFYYLHLKRHFHSQAESFLASDKLVQNLLRVLYVFHVFEAHMSSHCICTFLFQMQVSIDYKLNSTTFKSYWAVMTYENKKSWTNTVYPKRNLGNICKDLWRSQCVRILNGNLEDLTYNRQGPCNDPQGPCKETLQSSLMILQRSLKFLSRNLSNVRSRILGRILCNPTESYRILQDPYKILNKCTQIRWMLVVLDYSDFESLLHEGLDT